MQTKKETTEDPQGDSLFSLKCTLANETVIAFPVIVNSMFPSRGLSDFTDI